MEKRGQFYLIAAIILIAVISGIALYQNYGKKVNTNVVIYDLGKELKVETGNVYDFGTYTSQDTEALIDDWTTKYYQYSKSQGNIEDWIFMYGDRGSIRAITFTLVTEGEISITTSASPVKVDIKREIKGNQVIGNINEGKVQVEFNNIKYDFELKDGENFFFVIKGGNSVAKG